MTVSKRQFQLLHEMGIPLWQRKNTRSASALSSNSTKTNGVNDDIDFAAIKSQPLFHDIIRSLKVSVGEVTPQHNSLSLGLIRWQFNALEEIHLSKNILVTPRLDILANCGKLKRQLWQIIQDQTL